MTTMLTPTKNGAAIADSYQQAIEMLDAELRQLDDVFRGLSEEEWLMSTKLVPLEDRKSTRLNSSHSQISYAVFCLKKKKKDSTVSHVTIHNRRSLSTA